MTKKRAGLFLVLWTLLLFFWVFCIGDKLTKSEFVFLALQLVSLCTIMVLFIVALFILIYNLIQFLIKRQTKAMKISGWIFLFVFSYVIAFILTLKIQVRLSEKNADQIILALEKYRVAHQFYPEDLYALEPVFLKNVPCSRMGWGGMKFAYFPKDDFYELSFHVPLSIVKWFTYDSNNGYWEFD